MFTRMCSEMCADTPSIIDGPNPRAVNGGRSLGASEVGDESGKADNVSS